MMKFHELLSRKNADFQSIPPVCAAFLGDSVTHGVFECSKGYHSPIDAVYDDENVYHALLKRMLAMVYPAAPVNTINAGVSGGSAMQGYMRIERDILPFSPSLVVVCFGLNDVHGGNERIEDYAGALSGIFHKLKAQRIETIFLTPNMMNTYVSPQIKDELLIDIAGKTAGLQNDGTMDAYMERARSICIEESIPICDCYQKWKALSDAGVDTTSLLANHINHPTRAMHQLFATALFDMILFEGA